jgi:putative transposase
MLVRQAFKYEIRPTGQQQRQMLQFVGACRFVFNKALALQKENHEAGNKFIRYESLARLLTAWRNDPATPGLKDAPCHPLQHARSKI